MPDLPDLLAFELAGKHWDVFLLLPGAVLGAVVGLAANIWWDRMRAGSEPASTTAPSPPVAVTVPPDPSIHGNAIAGATAESHAASISTSAANITVNQVINLPRHSKGNGGGTSHSSPSDEIAAYAIGAFVAVVALIALYAWARPIIEISFLLVGALAAGLSLTLFVTTLMARVLGGLRWATIFGLSAAVFLAAALTPWIIHGAPYPFKDYDEVLRLVEARPFEVSGLYGGTGMKFVLAQLIGVVWTGGGALMALVVVASILGVSSLVDSRIDARLARFRQRPVLGVLLSAAIVGVGLWLMSGKAYERVEEASYARDVHAPRVFEIAASGSGTRRALTFRADEPVSVTLAISRDRRRAPVRTIGGEFSSGAGSIRFRLPRWRQATTFVLTLRTTDKAGNQGPARVLKLEVPGGAETHSAGVTARVSRVVGSAAAEVCGLLPARGKRRAARERSPRARVASAYLLILIDVSILMAALPRIHADLHFSGHGFVVGAERLHAGLRRAAAARSARRRRAWPPPHVCPWRRAIHRRLAGRRPRAVPGLDDRRPRGSGRRCRHPRSVDARAAVDQLPRRTPADPRDGRLRRTGRHRHQHRPHPRRREKSLGFGNELRRRTGRRHV
jgi:hypothetical protein